MPQNVEQCLSWESQEKKYFYNTWVKMALTRIPVTFQIKCYPSSPPPTAPSDGKGRRHPTHGLQVHPWRAPMISLLKHLYILSEFIIFLAMCHRTLLTIESQNVILKLKIMLPVRLELMNLWLWDWCAAYCAIEDVILLWNYAQSELTSSNENLKK